MKECDLRRAVALFLARCDAAATVAASFLRSAHEQGALACDPTRGFRAPKGNTGFAPRLLSERDLRRLLGAPDRRTHLGRRDLALLVCLGIGGLQGRSVSAFGERRRLVSSDTHLYAVRRHPVLRT